MKKKCKVCGAHLDNERCDYCGTDHGDKKQASSQLEDSSNHDIPTNDIPGFPSTQTQYSQPQQMMMESKKFNPTLMIGIVIVLIIAGGSWLFLNSRSLDAFALLARSSKVMEDVDSMIMDLDMQMRFTAPGIAIDIPLNARMYIEMLNDSDLYMKLEMEMDMFGMTESVNMYFRDGYFYTVEDGNVTRELLDSEAALDQAMDNMMVMDSLFDFDSDMIESSSVRRIDEGYRLEFTLNNDATMDLLARQDGMDMFDLNDSDFEDGDAVITIYLDENYRQTTFSLDMSIPFTEDGITGAVSMLTTLTYVQIGNVTVHFPDYLDHIGESPHIRTVGLTESPLLGYWENGSGDVFLWVFNQADSVHFLENGTVIITEDGVSETATWEVTELGAFTVNDRAFTYAIQGDVLTITDSSNDNWSFERGITPDIDVVDVDSAISTTDIIGSWEWDGNSRFVYTFNEDGTGVRGGGNYELEEFEWYISAGNLHLEFDSIAMFHVDYEMWSITIIDGILTLASLQGGGTFSYIRQ